MHEEAQVGKLMRALGLMSGTSMDGIDVALIDTDGAGEVVRGPSLTIPYGAATRRGLVRAMTAAHALQRREERPLPLAEAEREITELHAAAVSEFLRKRGIDPASVGCIGFHGQTVLHRPQAGLTVQLGDGPLLARLTGLDVVYDMRAADCAAGGQGAPLVPAYHRALAIQIRQLPIAFLNVGGVANVTWVGGDGRLIAFDTGPGNALVDDFMRQRSGVTHDENGATAARGKVSEAIVADLLRHEHFVLPPPKSLDRNAFAVAEAVAELSTEDGAATLTAFTAGAIAKAREHFPQQPQLWVVCGGGRRNRTLMSMIAGNVENAVVPAEAVGLDGDGMEAEAWAYLAVRSCRGLPLTFPGTTGVREPITGGVFAAAKS